MAKIGIDLTYILRDEPSGIRKRAEEVIEGLLKYTDYDITLYVDKDLEDSFKKNYPKCEIISIKTPFKNVKYVRGVCNRTYTRRMRKNKINNSKFDILFHPYSETIKVTPLLGIDNEISSILDLIPMDIIEDKESNKYKNFKEKYLKLINKNKYVLTISEYTKKRILETEPNFNGEILVIPESIKKPNYSNKSIKKILGKDQKYILSLNSFLRHKNQITLLKAFNRIKDQIDQNLVLVGRPELGSLITGYHEVIDYIKENKLEDRVKILSFIPDEDRNSLLYNTDLFVSTSTQEGFGRTPVEAALCEVPVISSCETSLKEATKDLVYYYENPYDDEELANKILEVLKKPPTKKKLEQIAKKLEKEYSQENIIKQYDKLFKKVLKKKEK